MYAIVKLHPMKIREDDPSPSLRPCILESHDTSQPKLWPTNRMATSLFWPRHISTWVSNANVHADLDKSNLSKQIPLGRVGKAEEVADAAAFLASNSYANNCVLTIDGGLNATFRGS